MDTDKGIFDFIPVLCTKSAMGFEAGRIYAAYPHDIGLFGVIQTGNLNESGRRELPTFAPGHVMRKAVGGTEIGVPWEEDSQEEWPRFMLDAFEIKYQPPQTCAEGQSEGQDGE